MILSPAKSAHLLQAEQREHGSPLLLSERGFEMIFERRIHLKIQKPHRKSTLIEVEGVMEGA